MGRGLGDLQRRIIDAGRATQTVWECGVDVALTCGSLIPVDGFKQGRGRDGVERWYGSLIVRTQAEFDELRSRMDFVYLRRDSVNLELVSNATWIVADVLSRLFPDLFGRDHRRMLPYGDHAYKFQLPDDIRRAKAVAKASVVRAMTTMDDRGLTVSGYALVQGDAVAGREWQFGYRGNQRIHGCRLVTATEAVKR